MIIKITNNAKKQIRKLPQLIQLAIGKKIREMSVEQENVQIKKLVGRIDTYRVRVGSYRIVYQQQSGIVVVVAVQHRKDVYRGEY
jgi:mRNA interferase RelE/StbE